MTMSDDISFVCSPVQACGAPCWQEHEGFRLKQIKVTIEMDNYHRNMMKGNEAAGKQKIFKHL